MRRHFLAGLWLLLGLYLGLWRYRWPSPEGWRWSVAEREGEFLHQRRFRRLSEAMQWLRYLGQNQRRPACERAAGEFPYTKAWAPLPLAS